MSDYTTTPNLGLYKPTYDADAEQWGAHLNANSDALDAAFSPTGGRFLPLAGGTMTGMLTLAAQPVNPMDAATRQYADKMLPLAGGQLTGPLDINHAYPSTGTTLSIEIARNNTTATFPSMVVVNTGTGGSVTSAPSPPAYYAFNNNSDSLAAASVGGAYGFMTAIDIKAGATGDRTGLFATVNRSQASSNTANCYYVAGYFTSNASANDGGTAGTALGAVLGINALAQLDTTATHYQSLAIAEFDINAKAGCNVLYKTGISIIQGGDSAVQGSVQDMAFMIANNPDRGPSVGWKNGICFGSPLGIWAMDPAGTMLGTMATSLGGPAYATGYGIDFRAVTFATAAFASNGFSVDQTGHVTLADPTANTHAVSLQYYNGHLPLASSTTPLINGTAAVGTGTTWARADHVHPTDTSRAPIASPTFTGTVTAPTLTSTGDVNVANGSHLWLVPGVVGMNWSGAAIAVTHAITVPTLEAFGGLSAWGVAPPGAKPNVTGSKGANAALAALMTALVAYGLITDSTT